VAGVRDSRIGPGIVVVSFLYAGRRIRLLRPGLRFVYHCRSRRLWLYRGRLARRSSGEASRPDAQPGQSSGHGRFPGREMAEDPVAISPGIRATPVNVVTREEMSWVSAAGMRFLRTPSVDSPVNSPVPSIRRLFRRDGPTVPDDGAAIEQDRRRDPLRWFHPGSPGRRVRLAPGR
jgi:hypothetical protein